MKQFIVLMFLVFSAIFSNLIAEEVDLAKSSLIWKGEKIAGFHEGAIGLKVAQYSEKDGLPLDAYFEVDMNSIQCSDLPAGKLNETLVGHLKSADFFESSKFPLATFKMKKASVVKKGESFKVDGDLTIKGITLPNSFVVQAKKSKEGKTELTGVITIQDRTAYNIKYNSGKIFDVSALGDKLIKDTFTISFKIVLK